MVERVCLMISLNSRQRVTVWGSVDVVSFLKNAGWLAAVSLRVWRADSWSIW